jgi:2,3-dihydroxybenzoate-AMP ligase
MSSAATERQADPDVVPYPPELVERYRATGVWGTNTIAEEFRVTAAAYPDRPAVLDTATGMTYADLERRSDLIALRLHELGLRPGGRALLQLTNGTGAVVAWYGLLKAGLVPVATLAQHRRYELGEIARQTDPVVHVVQADFAGHDLVALGREIAGRQKSLATLLTVGEGGGGGGALSLEALASGTDREADRARAVVDEIQASLDPEGLAVLQLSGGTTSIPKLIPRLHVEYWANAHGYARAIGMDHRGCVAHLLPVIHNAGICCGVHTAHAVGGCFALCAPTAADFTELAASGRITHVLTVRPLAQLVRGDAALRQALQRSLEVLVWADRDLPDDIRDWFETPQCRIQQMFGMGEGMIMVTPADAPVEVRHRYVGKPINALDEVRVYAPGTEEPVGVGDQGELCCRGPVTIRGYYRASERNREAFTADGFYRTGDIVVEGRVDGVSYYALADRVKDLISRGGEKINAVEVEGLLLRHPAIDRAALVSMPDARLGERACAFVVPAPGREAPTVAELRVFLEGLGVAKFKWPERVEARDDLPLTNVQKVNKVALRREIAALIESEPN